MFFVISQSKENTNDLMVDDMNNGDNNNNHEKVDCGKKNDHECKEGKNGTNESVFENEDYVYTQSLP
ncbi:hypothetical protein LIER_08781 [Lithospermum erythrorhizon]|uniref:Uncharacterized protein n=1 Tax=Lithospermum erythrorhizon TaxID=34254 RepID=A0AAV3PE59_LITER